MSKTHASAFINQMLTLQLGYGQIINGICLDRYQICALQSTTMMTVAPRTQEGPISPSRLRSAYGGQRGSRGCSY